MNLKCVFSVHKVNLGTFLPIICIYLHTLSNLNRPMESYRLVHFPILPLFKNPFAPVFQRCNYFHSACFRLCNYTSTNGERVSFSRGVCRNQPWKIRTSAQGSVTERTHGWKGSRYFHRVRVPLPRSRDILPILFSFWHRSGQAVWKFYVCSPGKCNSHYFCRV